MKKLFITLALSLPTALMAEEAADTTVTYHNRQFVISEDSLETRVSVYTADGSAMKKARETSFVSSQEVERIYVSSPLLPGLGTQYCQSMYPTIWWGTTMLSTRRGGSSEKNSGQDGLHTRGGDFEVGFTTAEMLTPLGRRGEYLFSTAVQVVYNRYNFQNSALLGNDGHRITFTDRTDSPASASQMSTSSMRLPLMLAWAPTANWPSSWLSTQFGLALVPEYRFGKGAYVFRPEAFGDPIHRNLKLYHWGLNLDLNMVLGPVKLGATVSLLPLFKTADGAKAYRSSINFGINIGELFGKRSSTVTY